MPRWVKYGGWIPLLALLIFLTFCVFYITYSQSHANDQSDRFNSPSPQFGRGFAGSISIVSLSVSGSDADLAPASPKPSIDSEFQETSDTNEVPENSAPHNDDAAGFDMESENEDQNADDETEIENQEQTLLTSDESGGIAALSEETEVTETQTDLEDTLTVLLQIRDILNIQLYVYTFVIAALIVYLFIFRPLSKFTQ